MTRTQAIAKVLELDERDVQVRMLGALDGEGLELNAAEAFAVGRLSRLIREEGMEVLQGWRELQERGRVEGRPAPGEQPSGTPSRLIWRWSWALQVEVEALELGLTKEETCLT